MVLGIQASKWGSSKAGIGDQVPPPKPAESLLQSCGMSKALGSVKFKFTFTIQMNPMQSS